MGIYQRKDGVWYYSFMYKGQTYIKSSSSKNKSKCMQMEAKKRQELFEQVELGIKPEILLMSSIDQYILSQVGTTRYRNLTTYGNWYKTNTKKLKLHELSTAVFNQLIDKKRAEVVSEGSLRNYIQFLKNVVTYARDRGFRVPVELLTPKTKPTKHKIRYLTLEEERKLLDMLNPEHPNNRSTYYKRSRTKGATFMQDDYDLVVCLLDTGCRKSEIMNMTWNQVNLDKQMLNIYRSKTKSETLLYMTDRVYDVMKRRYSTKINEWIFSDEVGTGPRKSVEGIKNVLKKLGMDDVVIHTLRHTFASKALNAGLQLYEVSKILGHKNLQTTQIYSHLDMNSTAIKTKDLLNEINKLG